MSKKSKETSTKRNFIKRTVTVIVSCITVLLIVVVLVANSLDGAVKILQAYLYHSVWDYPPNSFEPRSAPSDVIREDGLRVRTEVRYGDLYPNSYFDIWYPDAQTHIKRPVVIFIHGGGWFMGDKATGDPLAGSDQEKADGTMVMLAQHGFAVVNLNYALTPEYRYPTQMHQLNQAIGFLAENADELGVDMTNLVVMGGSAGAQMTAQYGLIASDSSYASEVGIKPAIDLTTIKALVIYSAPLKFSGFGWRMNAMLWSYLGTKDLESSKLAQQVNILSHIGPQYPPTYITDGNQADTFPEHAKIMAQRLREHKIDYIFNYYEPEEALLGHGYTGDLASKQGRENIEKTIEFIKARTGLAK